jgi:hypothetical protein
MNTYLEFIRPAMMDLAREVEPRPYRCEASFRMDFVLSLSPRLGLRAGERDKPLRPEEMTVARYSWGGRDPRRGNLDFVLRDTSIECNYAYRSAVKIEQDFVKLLDYENGFTRSAYLVFGHSNILRERIGQGFRAALSFLMAKHHVMCLSRRVDIILVEDLRDRRGGGSLRFWEANLEVLNGVVNWHEVRLENWNGHDSLLQPGPDRFQKG